MKSILFSVLIALSLGAQEDAMTGIFDDLESDINVAERANKATQAMTKSLNLTDEQAPKIQDVNVWTFTELDKVRKSGSGRYGRMRAMRAIMQERNSRLKKILTEDQFKIVEKQQEARRERMRKRFRRGM